MPSTGGTPQSQPPITSASEPEQQPSSMNTSSSSPTEVRASEIVHPSTGGQHDPKTEASGEIPPTSVFVNSEPMREEQVQNAVKFLSHPKVRGSPIIYRRSFLEKKGLTKEEIDEAFRRVPDPPQNVFSTQPTADGQMKPLTNVQPQIATQNLQPSAAAPSGVISPNVTWSRFHWSHALLAVGFLALSGAGTAVLFKNAVLPRLKSWIRKVILEEEEEEEESAKKTNSKPSLEQEATAAAKAAAADVAQVSQEMLISKTEEKKYFEELLNLIRVQVQEMKSMSNAIEKLEVQGNTPGRTPLVEQDHRVPTKSSRQPNANTNADFDLYSPRSLSPPTTAEPSVGPHPKSYMEIMAMVQRGEKLPNIREINDQPPNPNQPLPNANSASRSKPWELGQSQNSYSQVLQSHESSYGLNSNLQDNGDGSVPWWQRKNVRITEIKNEDEMKNGYSDVPINEQPVQRSWVPPQPPPVAMPEAAAAIRQLKKTVFQKQVADDRLAANPLEVTDDELQRITKISESGGAVDANGESSGPKTNEIQEETRSQLVKQN